MTEPSESRAIQLSIEVPGTPEEVWAAIASGPGITSWFVPATVDGRPEGQVTFDFGEHGEEAATVTAWEPPHRIAFQSDRDRALAYEWLVEARDGGTCIVRLVNSGFGPGDDWDGDYDAMTHGWTIFLQVLRLHLTHFRGREARAFVPSLTLPGPHDHAWASLCRTLGVPADLRAGDQVTVDRPDLPPLTATVDTVIAAPSAATAYTLLLDNNAGTAFISAEGDGDDVVGSMYLYLYDEASTLGDEWARALAQVELLPDNRPPRFSGGVNIAMKIPAADYEATLTFYRDTLGLPVNEEAETGSPDVHASHSVQFGPNTLWLDRVDRYSRSDMWLEIRTDDLDAATAQLADAGIPTCDEVERLDPEAKAHWIRSPAGTVHLLAQNTAPTWGTASQL